MTHLLLSVGLLVVSGFAALLVGRRTRMATLIGVGGASLACGYGLVAVLPIFLSGGMEQLMLPWEVPFGSFHVRIDALSSFFLIPIFLLSGVAAPYGGHYLSSSDREAGRFPGAPWLFYNLLIAGMVLVVIAWNAIVFIMAWELMSLASYFLVTMDHEKPSVRDAGWIYLMATHLGTAFLFVLFLMMGPTSLDFDALGPGTHGSLLFLFAVIGFGTKAGFVPLHVWLPEAHPAAPSHVSAVMSGVMIKTGIYGLLRMITLLGPPPLWWGMVMIGIGLSSGVLGVLFALAQHDLKRLLAYHSVENIGIIAIGIGLGMIGMTTHSISLMSLGFAGALLHVLNHALFKGLLFLGAGAVLHATHTLEIDRLGGLLKRMPQTAIVFLTGAVAISALPPLNGFISEFLMYFGAVRTPHAVMPAVIGGLALIGGLAAACFAKAFGMVFLGQPRTELTGTPHDPGVAMMLPMWILAFGCLAVGLLAPWGITSLAPAVAQLSGFPANEMLADAQVPLTGIVLGTTGFLILGAILVGLRAWLLSGREVRTETTWGCGYAHPTPRMQYTSSSFANPITSLFHTLIRTRRHEQCPEGIHPMKSTLVTHAPSLFREFLYRPIYHVIERVALWLHWLHHGHVHLYVVTILVTLVVLLVWNLA